MLNTDSLCVDWNLVNFCNYQCADCSDTDIRDCVMIPERIMDMAWKILSLPRAAYFFNFYGGETLLHPYFKELISYIYSSGRKISIRFNTNCSQEIAEYIKVFRMAQPDTMSIIFSARPENIHLEKLLHLIAAACENNVRANVRLFYDSERQAINDNIFSCLCKLQAMFKFAVEVDGAMLVSASSKLSVQDDASAWGAAIMKSFPSFDIFPPIVAGKQENDIEVRDSHSQAACGLYTFSCLNYLSIEPNGEFYGLRNKEGKLYPPLWRYSRDDFEQLLHISRFQGETRQTPNFKNRSDAAEWLSRFKKRVASYYFAGRPLPNPTNRALESGDEVVARIHFFDRDNAISQTHKRNKQTIFPLYENRHTVSEIYASLDNKGKSAYAYGWFVYISAQQSTAGNLIRIVLNDGLQACADRTKSILISDLAELEKNIAKIRQFQLRIKANGADLGTLLLRIPQLILRGLPDYRLGYSLDSHTGLKFYAEPPLAMNNALSSFSNLDNDSASPKVSVIVPTFNSADVINRCLNSILIQEFGEFEIIVVDDCSTDSTYQIVLERARQSPIKIRPMRLAKNSGPGVARAMGLDLALGKYVCFVDSDDLMAGDFLKKAVSAMADEEVDIVAMDMISEFKSKRQKWDVAPGTWPGGVDALRQYLLKAAGCYGVVGKLYRKAMLRDKMVKFWHTAVHEDMFFCIQAFYNARKLVVLSESGYLRIQHPGSLSSKNHGSRHFYSLVDYAYYITEYCKDRCISLTEKMYSYAVTRAYTWDRERILNTVLSYYQKNRLKELLTPEYLEKIVKTRKLLTLFLTDCARLYSYRRRMLSTCVVIDAPLPYTSVSNDVTVLCYKTQDYPSFAKTRLTLLLIISNDSFLTESLDAIRREAVLGVEMLIVTSPMSPEAEWHLRRFADGVGYAKILSLPNYAGWNQMLKIGIENASGDYVSVFDNGDVIMPGFVNSALELSAGNHVDMVVFSTQELAENGVIRVRYDVLDQCINGGMCRKTYWSGGMPPGLLGKVIKKERLLNITDMISRDLVTEDLLLLPQLVEYLRVVVMKGDLGASKRLTKRKIFAGLDAVKREIKALIAQLASAMAYAEAADWPAQPLQEQRILRIIGAELLAMWGFWQNNGGSDDVLEASPNSDLCYLVSWCLQEFSKSWVKGAVPEGLLSFCVQRRKSIPRFEFTGYPDMTFIITTRNDASVIGDCVYTILSQYLINLEIIIIDDNSDDGTWAHLNEIARSDKRLRLWRNGQRLGRVACLRIALKKALGRHIVFLDANEQVCKDFSLSALTKLKMCTELELLLPEIKEKDSVFDTNSYLYPDAALKLILMNFASNNNGNIYASSTGVLNYVVLKKELLLANGIDFNGIFAEVFLLLQCAKNAKRIGLLSCGEARKCRVSTAGKMESSLFAPHNLTYDFVRLFDIVREIVSRYGMKDNNPLKLIRAEFMRYVANLGDIRYLTISNLDTEALRGNYAFMKAFLNDYACVYVQERKLSFDLPFTPVSETLLPDAASRLIPLYKNDVNDEKPLFSIIITGGATAKFLDTQLINLAEQRYANFEVIVAQDGQEFPTIATAVQKHAHKFAHISLFMTNMLTTEGRLKNLALMHARGDFVLIVDRLSEFDQSYLFNAADIINSSCERPQIIIYSSIGIEKNADSVYRLAGGSYSGSSLCPDIMTKLTENIFLGDKLFSINLLRDNDIRFSDHINRNWSFIIPAFMYSKICIVSDIIAVIRKSSLECDWPAPEAKIVCSMFNDALKILDVINCVPDKILRRKLSYLFVDLLTSDGSGFERNTMGYISKCHIDEFPLSNDEIDAIASNKVLMQRFLYLYAMRLRKA